MPCQHVRRGGPGCGHCTSRPSLAPDAGAHCKAPCRGGGGGLAHLGLHGSRVLELTPQAAVLGRGVLDLQPGAGTQAESQGELTSGGRPPLSARWAVEPAAAAVAGSALLLPPWQQPLGRQALLAEAQPAPPARRGCAVWGRTSMVRSRATPATSGSPLRSFSAPLRISISSVLPSLLTVSRACWGGGGGEGR
jgi:hypothetical protein